jgi:hypothetical protein
MEVLLVLDSLRNDWFQFDVTEDFCIGRTASSALSVSGTNCTANANVRQRASSGPYRLFFLFSDVIGSTCSGCLIRLSLVICIYGTTTTSNYVMFLPPQTN